MPPAGGKCGMLELVLEMRGEAGGESPEENIGSDEPVRRDAAVAAAATLE